VTNRWTDTLSLYVVKHVSNKSCDVASKQRDAACLPTPNDSDYYLLQLTKGQGRYSTGSPSSTKSRLYMKLKRINNGACVLKQYDMCNDSPRSSKVVDFGTNRNRNLSAILPHFRAIVHRKPLFLYHVPILAKILGCPLGVDP